MPGTNVAPEHQASHVYRDTQVLGYDFELHYGLTYKSVRDILEEILEDISSNKHVHNWDKKLLTSPLQSLVNAGRKYLKENRYALYYLLAHSMVEEALTVGGFNHESPILQEAGDISSHLFFTKRSSQSEIRLGSPPTDTINPPPTPGGDLASEDDAKLLHLSQGRVVYIKEQIPHLERATLLTFYAFCIRLQCEDYGYIRTFIERHLGMRSILKEPYHWQQTSPPYLSCHITYLTLDCDNATERNAADMFDRSAIFSADQFKDVKSPSKLQLFKASSSILLTLAIPEESVSHEEEVGLLRVPQALWTVLAVNCSSEFASAYEPRQHLTPIAQYLRGITSSLYTQRMNAKLIHEALKDALKSCDGASIFDDEHFTKSTAYHWAVRTCDELSESIASSIRFTRRVQGHIDKLCAQQLKEEIFALEDLQAQILAMSSQVQERLHGVTAVLEARTALQQGDRLKILAYLATVYLPLTASSSLYSMSVLPKSATFPSFFVVFTGLFLSTILLGTNIWPLLAGIPPKFQNRSLGLLAQLFASWILHYIEEYTHMLNPYRDYTPNISYELRYLCIPIIFRGIPIFILRGFLLHKIYMPRDQYILYLYRDNRFMHVKYHPVWFVKDVIRAIFIPAWLALATSIICYLVLLDILWGLALGFYLFVTILLRPSKP
ncbi:hypothetical protein B0O99DRAFT_656496 [Bisporella sp. PMI_857]|nr:hypothetical protein B0O99DRAFT_656496 [Bisporella sp. PMI_857]